MSSCAGSWLSGALVICGVAVFEAKVESACVALDLDELFLFALFDGTPIADFSLLVLSAVTVKVGGHAGVGRRTFGRRYWTITERTNRYLYVLGVLH